MAHNDGARVFVRRRCWNLRPLPLAFFAPTLSGKLGLLLIVLAAISHQRIFVQKLFIQK
jgi:hypothetical protein